MESSTQPPATALGAKTGIQTPTSNQGLGHSPGPPSSSPQPSLDTSSSQKAPLSIKGSSLPDSNPGQNHSIITNKQQLDKQLKNMGFPDSVVDRIQFGRLGSKNIPDTSQALIKALLRESDTNAVVNRYVDKGFLQPYKTPERSSFDPFTYSSTGDKLVGDRKRVENQRTAAILEMEANAVWEHQVKPDPYELAKFPGGERTFKSTYLNYYRTPREFIPKYLRDVKPTRSAGTIIANSELNDDTPTLGFLDARS